MRITRKLLESKANAINEIRNRPTEQWRKEGERNVSNIGHYTISGAYGGYSLHEICTDGGGVHDTFRCGHIPARELAMYMDGYLTALYELEQAEREAKRGLKT